VKREKERRQNAGHRIQKTGNRRRKTEDRTADLPTSGGANRKLVPDYLGLILFMPLCLCFSVPSKAGPAWTKNAKQSQFSGEQIDAKPAITMAYGDSYRRRRRKDKANRSQFAGLSFLHLLSQV